MIKNRKRALVLLSTIATLILLLATAIPASAFTYDGKHWDADYVYYDMSGVPAGWQYPIMYAASAWNQAGADWMFAGSSSSHDLTTGDLWDWVLAWTYVYSSSNIIFDCDTVFNTTDFDFYTFSLQN